MRKLIVKNKFICRIMRPRIKHARVNNNKERRGKVHQKSDALDYITLSWFTLGEITIFYLFKIYLKRSTERKRYQHFSLSSLQSK